MLAAVFAAAIALSAILVYFQVTAKSYRDLSDSGLAERTAEIVDYMKTYGASPINLDPTAKVQFEFNQVVDPHHKVVIASSLPIKTAPVLPARITDPIGDDQVLHLTYYVKNSAMVGDARIRASVKRYQGVRYVIIVGSRLDAINKARHRLIVLLAIAVPGSFLTAGLLVYLIGYIGLRGMRRLTAEADELSTAVPIKQLGPQSTFELQELADHLNAMLARLGETSRNEHTFIAAASHDLRGSLANVLSQVEYAALLPPGEEQHRQVLVAKDSVQQATQYLNDLLNASRLRGGPVSSEDQEPIDLARLSEHVAAAARERFPDKTVTISGAATVMADPTDARQAVSNLIDNAARHAEQRVDVELASVDHTATISIRDDGPGYPDRVLQTFHDPLPRYGNLKVGSGLGLMTARDAARRNGGEVELRNKAPGAEAVLRLPATSSPFDDDEDDLENAGGAG